MLGDIFYVVALIIFALITLGIFKGHFSRKVDEINKDSKQ